MAKLTQGINDLATTYPQIASEWDFKKNYPLTPQQVTKGSNFKVWWQCSQGHSYEAQINNRTMGQGCPYCKGKKVWIGFNDLVTTNPQIANEWDYTKNYPLTPQQVTKGAGKKVWWLCPKGHSYEAIILDRTQSDTGCPICSGHKVLIGYNDLVTTHPQIAKEWDYDKNYPLTPQQVSRGSRKKVWWLCPKGHSYEAIISNRTVLGNGCRYCAGQVVIQGLNDLESQNPEIANEWDYEKNYPLTPQQVTRGTQKKVWWLCPKGHSYETTIAHRTNADRGCPYCSGQKVLIGFNDIATTHPHLLQEWDYEKNKPLTPQKVSKGKKEKVWWLCSKGHSYDATISHRISGRGCPYCNTNKLLQGFNDLATTHPQLVKEWDYDKNYPLTPQKISKGSRTKVWWLCPNGHSYKTTVMHRTYSHTDCTFCNGSKTERLLYAILEKRNITYTTERKFEQSIKVKYYPYDIYIAKYRIIIEADGIQHFNDLEYFSGTPFVERVRRDNVKNDFCFDLPTPIPILRIPYTYNPDTERDKIEKLVMDFIETRKVPQEILDFYKPYKESIGSNYYDIATKMNEIKWNGCE